MATRVLLLAGFLVGVTGAVAQEGDPAREPSDKPARYEITLRGRANWIPALTALAKSGSPTVRGRAAFLLGQTGDSAGQSALRRLQTDADRDVRIHAGIALGYLKDRSALGTCRAALVDGPNWRRVYAAAALAKIGTADARDAVRRALNAQPQHIASQMRDVLNGFGGTPGEKGWRAENAPAKTRIAVPQKSQGLFEIAADILFGLTDRYWHEGDHESCMRLMYAAVFLDPSFADAWTSLAWLTWSNGRTQEAESIYRAGLAANPNRYEVWFEFGFHYYRLKKYDLAASYFARARSFRDCPLRSARMHAHALEKAGDLPGALKVWQELLAVDTDPVVRRNYERVRSLVQGDASEA